MNITENKENKNSSGKPLYKYEDVDLFDLRCSKYLPNSPHWKEAENAIKIKAKAEAKAKTLALQELRERKRRATETFNIIGESAEVLLKTNEVFDQIGHDGVNLPVDDGTSGVLSLESFFRRPLILHTANIELNSTALLDFAINPWDRWSKDPTVLAKLSNFSYFKGDLTVRIVITSHPMAVGGFVISYQPFAGYNPILAVLETDSQTLGSQGRKPLINYLSQSPEVAYSVLGSDTDIEMKIPFIYPYQHLSLFNADGSLITSATGFDEFDFLGKLYFKSLTTLDTLFSGSSGQDVNITIYGWMDNVELGSPTSTNIDISAESKEVKKKVKLNDGSRNLGRKTRPMGGFATFRDKINSNPFLNKVSGMMGSYTSDEYKDAGPVTKISSAVSNLASTLNNVPILNNFSSATSYAASKIAGVANFFGFSRPFNVDPYASTVTHAYSNMSLYNTKDTAVKLTGDPKQELALLNMGGDTDTDPMSIAYLVSRESLFYQISWNTSSVALTPLATFPLNPALFYSSSTNGASFLTQPSALSYVAKCFKYWRGTITFRFQVMCNSYFKGKLLFVYEPDFFQRNLISSDPIKLNQTYSYVLDLNEGNEAIIDVQYDNRTSFLGVDQILENDSKYAGNGTFAFANPLRQNGYLRVYVLNPLTTIRAAIGVKINCFVSSPDMQFAVPYLDHENTQSLFIQSESEEVTESNVQAGPNVVSAAPKVAINVGTENSANIYRYNFGEAVYSFRSILNRSEVCRADDALGLNVIYPLYPSPCPYQFPQKTGITFTEQLSNTGTINLFNYLRYAYIGVRGGMRYRMMVINNSGRIPTLTAGLYFPKKEHIGGDVLGGGTFRPNIIGSHSFPSYSTSCATLEIEVPYISSKLFDLSMLPYKVHDSTHPLYDEFNRLFLEEQGQTLNFFVSVPWEQPPSATYQNEMYSSTAEDFSFFRFQGAPYFTANKPIINPTLLGDTNARQ